VATLALVACASLTELDGGWTRAAAVPARVQELHAAVLSGRIYVAGGFDSTNQATRAAFRYDPALDRWEPVADLPEARHHMPLVVVGDTLYAVGGLVAGSFNGAANLWLYRDDLDQWLVRASLPVGRGASAAVAVNGELVVVGGMGPTQAHVDSVAIYNPAANAWRHGRPIPTLRDHLTAQAVGGIVYAIGGRPHDPDRNYDRVEAYDVAADTWSARAAMPSRRGGLSSAVIDGRIHTLGGETSSRVFDNHEVYDPATDRWATAPKLPTARHGLAVAALGSRLYAIAGGPQAGFAQTDVVETFAP
jgi:N-acetylneuraminic acid mutarotase